MQIDIEPVKRWFGYNRKERRASLILILLITLVLSARMFVPSSNTEIRELSLQLNSDSDSIISNPGISFTFDPNTASFDTLLLAGLNEKEARTLISYRNKGGRFRKPSDIRRLYGIDTVKANRLMTHISIPQETTYRVRYQKRTPVDLNSCDSAMLERLPGIGPVLSARIIRYRSLLGGFVSVGQLKEVYGLPPETFERIRSLVYADTSLIRKTNINTADYSALTGIPYLRRFQVTDIMKFRELTGKINSLDDLVENNIITDTMAIKIRPYVIF